MPTGPNRLMLYAVRKNPEAKTTDDIHDPVSRKKVLMDKIGHFLFRTGSRL